MAERMDQRLAECVKPTTPRATKDSRYERTAKGLDRRATANDRRNEASLHAYLNRPFVAWDGEGGNEDDGSHTYFLLASSDGAYLSDRSGLATETVFDLWLQSREGVTNIIYGGNYDVNMVLRDLDRDSLEHLYRTGRVTWHGYRLEWRSGKSFAVRHGKRHFLLYDVLPFFQRPFVAACDEYLGTDWEYRDQIIREKARRGTFNWDELGSVSDYNRAELSTLVRLANELRQRLYKVEIRVKRWDGPGAIAASLYQKYRTKSHLDAPPHLVTEAGRHAYAGGRFEIIRKGHSTRPAFQYDIRSAYPSAARHLPCLAHGQWEHRRGHSPVNPAGFGMYRIEVITPSTNSVTQPQPLWMRNRDGTVYFSEYAHGWYWTPEAHMATELGGVIVHEAWVWHQECDHTPFHFVEPLYNKRAALKKAGDGAHVGLKLGLNSLYGKLAQQIGWDPGPPLRLPPYHSLEWAGYITSHCRAQVYRAALLAPDDVIAFETDAIFSRAPLVLNLGDRLGEWDVTEYESLTYLKSGMYFGTVDGNEVEKSRGINKGTLTRAQVIAALRQERGGVPVVLGAEQTRFIGLGAAMNTNMDKWRRWYTTPRNISVALNGKRIDLQDGTEHAPKNDGWTETQEGLHDTTFTHPYDVAWIESSLVSPEGLDLTEVRLEQAHQAGLLGYWDE